jgi:protein involved in ribonucleotide reduction
MIIAYASMTGKVKMFTDGLQKIIPNHEYVKVVRQMKIDSPFVLITYTTGFGQMPREVKELLDTSANNLVAVVGSGNRNWGDNFCGGAKLISSQYNVPLLHTFENNGYESDAHIVASKIKEIEGTR